MTSPEKEQPDDSTPLQSGPQSSWLKSGTKASLFVLAGVILGVYLARHTDVVPSLVVNAREIVPRESRDGISLELNVPGGVGITAKITVRNDGSQPFTFTVGGVADSLDADLTDAGEDSHFSFIGAGEYIHWSRVADRSIPQTTIRIASGGSVTYTIPLERWYDISAPGEYSLQGRYTSPDSAGLRIDSNTVQFTVW